MPYIDKGKLRELRKLHGYTLAVLARKSHIGITALSQYETTRCNIGYKNLQKIADAFNISVADFLDPTLTAETLFKYTNLPSSAAGAIPSLLQTDDTSATTPLVISAQMLVEADRLFSLPGYTSEDKEALLEAMRQIFAQ